MLYFDCIEKLIQLEDIIVTYIERIQNEMHIHLRMEQKLYHCLSCGCLTSKVHDYRIQLVKDFFMQIFEQLKSYRSIKDIAKDNKMSPPTAAKIIDLCILADPQNHKVLDVLPTGKHEDIYRYLGSFKNHKDVKIIVMDMTGGYKSLMKRLFPDAVIVIDKYHYVRQIGFAIEKVRIEEQKKYLDKWRKYFKRSKKLLVKDTSKMTTEDRLRLAIGLKNITFSKKEKDSCSN